MYRLGYLTPTTRLMTGLDAFRRALSGLGYTEGRNLEIIVRAADGDMQRIPGLAADLVRRKPDAILAVGSAAIAALKRATTSIPIVMTESTDPVGAGFIASLAHPGGNITGVADMDVELNGKWLQLFGELVPHLQRVAVAGNPLNPGNRLMQRAATRLAGTIGMTAFAVDIPSADRIDTALSALRQRRADALIVLGDPVTVLEAAHVVRLVTAQKVPAIYEQDSFIAAGGLMYYSSSDKAMFVQAASYVDQILKGANPGELPAARPTTFDLVVNLKAARAIGITIPQSILLQATQIIR